LIQRCHETAREAAAAITGSRTAAILARTTPGSSLVTVSMLRRSQLPTLINPSTVRNETAEIRMVGRGDSRVFKLAKIFRKRCKRAVERASCGKVTVERRPMIPYENPPLSLPANSARTMLVASCVITLALYLLPFGGFLARPFVLLSTLVHELGHGLTTLLLGGGFRRLSMWSSGAGVAELDTTGFGRIRGALTLAGGLVGPAVAAAIFFTLGRTAHGARACLLGLGVLLLLCELLVVRNLFGWVFTGLVAAACLLIALRGSPATGQLAVVFVAVQLALSVFSRADYLFTRVASNPNGRFASDVEAMAQLLWLPYWFWGFLCGAFSIAVLGWGLRVFWGK